MSKPLIQCVVVLYKQTPAVSQALTSLLEICARDPLIANALEILVHDNSPQVDSSQPLLSEQHGGVQIEYHHAPANPGLANAYNSALHRASKRDLPWLLLLDQDTCVTPGFIAELLTELTSRLTKDGNKTPCAFVPKLVHQGLVLSPQRVGSFRYSRISSELSGEAPTPIVAFNSAACIAVQDLHAIGGFPGEFWLDYLDHMVFHLLQRDGRKVFVLNAELNHNLSLVNIENEVSNQRYVNILKAEWTFVKRSGWGRWTSSASLAASEASHQPSSQAQKQILRIRHAPFRALFRRPTVASPPDDLTWDASKISPGRKASSVVDARHHSQHD